MATVVSLCRAAGFELTFSLTPGDAHDRTLIRACLNRTPAERLADMVIAVRAFARMAVTAERHGRV